MARTSQVTIEVGKVSDAAELQQQLMTALGFPVWYGRNWDAFHDAITGLVEMPLKLQLVGWSSLEARLPREAKLMRKCLDDMQVELPDAASMVEYA